MEQMIPYNCYNYPFIGEGRGVCVYQMKHKKTIVIVVIFASLLLLFKSELQNLILSAAFKHRPEPRISSIKKYFHADEVTKIGPFSTQLVRTSPYMYGYFMKQNNKVSVIVLDQSWGEYQNPNSNDYIIIFPGQSNTQDDKEAIDYIIKNSTMVTKLQTTDFVGNNPVEIHQGSTVTELKVYKLKDYSGGNLMWLAKDLRTILTYQEGLKALRDF
jgi:hypothetical protein